MIAVLPDDLLLHCGELPMVAVGRLPGGAVILLAHQVVVVIILVQHVVLVHAGT